MAGIKIFFKKTVSKFSGKFLLFPKWVNFEAQINTFEIFYIICSSDFSEVIPDDRNLKLAKSDNFDFFKKKIYYGSFCKHKNVRMKTFHRIFLLEFFEILCDGKHSKESKTDFFLDDVDYTQRNPLWTFLNIKLTCFIFRVSLLCFSC